MAEDAVAAGIGREAAIPSGTGVGPFTIERQVGRGGMSIVYAARQIALDRSVALKILLPSLAGESEIVERFLAEARAAARLDNPHIVPIYDTGEAGGYYFIAMRLLDGRDLRQMLSERRAAGFAGLPPEKAIDIIEQAAEALDFAHSHGIVHRDVKPANIYVDGDGRVTLVDFGIARALDHASSTITGSIIGTPAYMSPEQTLGLPVDFRSDVYSLGVVLYEALTGTPPFAGSPHAVMNAHASAVIPSLPQSRADLSAELDHVIRRAMAKRPDERFASAGATARAARRALGGIPATDQPSAEDADATAIFADDPVTPSGAASAPPSITGWPAAGSRQRARWKAGGIAGAAAIGAIAAAILWAFLAGPLASKDGRLAVNSTPAGASVSVDGSDLGVTPLSAHTFPAGEHDVVVDKPGYVPVKKTEQLRPRATETLNTTLTVLPASQLLAVQQALVASDVASGPNNTITVGAPVASVRANQEFGFVVTVAAKPVAPGDVNFSQQIVLVGPSGSRLTSSSPSNATVSKSDASGRSFAFTFHFNPNPDGSIPAGDYQLQFLVDGEPLVTRPIALVS
jgi:Protein kinase domain/PEGA domain